MKSIHLILAVTLFLMAGCEGCKNTGNGSDVFITVDVTASFPKKELILQNFMDVEYIAMETKDDFYNQGFIQDIGKEVILVRNHINDGDIFVYDRTGKALRKINRMGQGGEEYINILSITLDEDNGEMFVNDYYSKKFFVYDLYGKFKRSFRYNDGTKYLDVFNFDKNNLICYDNSILERNGEVVNNLSCFAIISKQDGSISREIQIPFKMIKSPITSFEGGKYAIFPSGNYSIIPYQGNWILREASSDTVYRYSMDDRMSSFIVRTPSIQSMNPEVFLFLRTLTDRYYFMETLKKEYDFETKRGYPRKFFMYDKQEKAFFGYNVYNGDFSSKREIYMNALSPVNHEIASWQNLEADDLFDAYKKGHLKGKLKDIAASLKEEDNPVIMLVKHKK